MFASAFVGFAGFNFAVFTAHMLAVPPMLFDPVCARVFNRWLYLTYQSNIMCMLYFGACLWSGAPIQLFPLVFALGAFLTIAYYVLDHFNAETRRRKDVHKQIYPYIHWASHLEHGHALPLVLLHAATVELPAGALPSDGDAARIVVGYNLFYLLLVHLNHALTGRWPYAVIDDVTRAGGVVGRLLFFAVLTAIFAAFALCGLAILRARVAQP